MAATDWSADCHASGAVQFIATAVKGVATIQLCGHCLTRHVAKLTDLGWDIVPRPRVRGYGVGTEATPDHFALDGN